MLHFVNHSKQCCIASVQTFLHIRCRGREKGRKLIFSNLGV